VRQNVIHIERFYASPLGKTARAMVNRRLDPLWPKDDGDLKGLDVLGFGYCAPYLMPYREQAGSLIFAMPEDQGAMISRLAVRIGPPVYTRATWRGFDRRTVFTDGMGRRALHAAKPPPSRYSRRI